VAQRKQGVIAATIGGDGDMRSTQVRLLMAAGLGVALVAGPALAAAPTTERVSVSSSGTQAKRGSMFPAISADGRYIAFSSKASNLVAGDTNGRPDVFVRDRTTGTTHRVNVSSSGTQANARSSFPAISADGRYIAFLSEASNLVAGDTNGLRDVFVRDRATGTTRRVNVSSSGTQANSRSMSPAISADGRYVAFTSKARNLVAGDTNAAFDVFVRDRTTGTTHRVSVSSSGTQASGRSRSDFPAISADGRYIAFASTAHNLVAGDTNGKPDVFVRNRATGTTRRVSVSSSGAQANGWWSGFPAISADGRYVAFESNASNLVAGDTNGGSDVFVRDRTSRTTRRVSVSSSGTQANYGGGSPAISADGRYIAFYSSASNLVAGDTNAAFDVFVRDRATGTTQRMNVSSSGTQGNAGSWSPEISADGRYVAFVSHASNLVAGDTNDTFDVFVRGPLN
jgi:Tol biopolymer transport system component